MIPTAEQIAMCTRFQSEIVPSYLGMKLGIALASLHLLPLNALRIYQSNDTCGWYIYGGESSEDSDFYQPLHVAHIEEHCPQIVPYLAMAPGWRIILAPDYEDVWFDEGILR